MRQLVVEAVDAVRDATEAAIGPGDRQLADRRVDHVVADVDETFADRGGTETCVELVVDGHWLLLSLRTPDDAAARAASSDEPRAAAMSS